MSEDTPTSGSRGELPYGIAYDFAVRAVADAKKAKGLFELDLGSPSPLDELMSAAGAAVRQMAEPLGVVTQSLAAQMAQQGTGLQEAMKEISDQNRAQLAETLNGLGPMMGDLGVTELAVDAARRIDSFGLGGKEWSRQLYDSAMRGSPEPTPVLHYIPSRDQEIAELRAEVRALRREMRERDERDRAGRLLNVETNNMVRQMYEPPDPPPPAATDEDSDEA